MVSLLRRRSATASAIVLALVACALSPARALADHPALDRAIAHVEDADFASALAAFEEAESSSSLDRDDLVRLYAQRATVHFALGELASMDADLARLLAVEPDATLPASAAPPVRDALEALRGTVEAPALRAEARASATGVEIRARVVARGGDLARGARVWGRPQRDAEWRRGDDGALSIDAAPGAVVVFFAEAIGPGGVVLASEGTRARPASFVVPAPEAAGGDETAWWVIGGSTAAVVIGAVITGVALGISSSAGETTLGGPVLVP